MARARLVRVPAADCHPDRVRRRHGGTTERWDRQRRLLRGPADPAGDQPGHAARWWRRSPAAGPQDAAAGDGPGARGPAGLGGAGRSASGRRRCAGWPAASCVTSELISTLMAENGKPRYEAEAIEVFYTCELTRFLTGRRGRRALADELAPAVHLCLQAGAGGSSPTRGGGGDRPVELAAAEQLRRLRGPAGGGQRRHPEAVAR